MTRTFAVGKSADRLGAFVFIGHEQLVEAFVAKGLEEAFAIEGCKKLARLHHECWAYMYGPGSSFKALKQRHVSSVKTGPPISER